MELSQEFIQENGLNEEQVAAITGEVKSHMTTELGTQVHEHTENTLSKVWETVNKVTGIEREKGEKYADALTRASRLHFEGKNSELDRKIQEYSEKIKNTKGDETLKGELQKAKDDLEKLKPIATEHEEWKRNDYKGKYEDVSSKLTKTEQRIAFSKVVDKRPDTVNKFEWDARIKEWETSVLEENVIKFDENDIAWAVNKEDDWKKTKLEDLYKENTELQELIKGRQQKGIGSNSKKVTIEGVPFEVPENATPAERQKAIKEYLASQNISKTSAEYSKQFAELNAKILQKKAS
jgi:hypothetical protein